MVIAVIPCLHRENFNESANAVYCTSSYLRRSLCLLGRDFLPVSLDKLYYFNIFGAAIIIQLLHVFLKLHFESFQKLQDDEFVRGNFVLAMYRQRSTML